MSGNALLAVGDVARATGLSVRVLHHWESLGLVQPARSSSGHRRYCKDDLVRLAQVVALRRTGLPLARVASLLDDDRRSAELVLRSHLHEIEDDLRRRTALRDRLKQALDDPRPDVLTEVIQAMVLLDDYVHGYRPEEGARLRDQAQTLAELLHHDTAYPPSAAVLELGCGVGAQTEELVRRSPAARFTCVDRSETSLQAARARLRGAGLPDVVLVQADVLALPDHQLRVGTFDAVFVCFLLEHLPEPERALVAARRLLRPGGTLTVIEGDHGSTSFHPDSAAAHEAVDCQVALQRATGGDPDLGRRLYPLLVAAGFSDVAVSPRQVYVDGSRPALADGFVRRTFTAMVEGVRTPALASGLTTAERFDEGVRDLLRTAEPDGVFSYTFYKATATAG